MTPIEPRITAHALMVEFTPVADESLGSPWSSIQQLALEQIFPVAVTADSVLTPLR